MSKRVSESEQRVLEVLWQASPLSSKQVVAALADEDWNERTVKTFLNRLLKKGAIDFEQSGRSYLYFPIVNREEFLREESSGFLNKIFGGDIQQLLATFVDSKQLSESDLKYLRDLLDDQSEGGQQK